MAGGFGMGDGDSDDYGDDDYGDDYGSDDEYGTEDVGNAKKAFGNDFDFGMMGADAALPGVDDFLGGDDGGDTALDAQPFKKDGDLNEENILL